MIIRDITCTVINATVQTNWVFVFVHTDEDLVGVGEATLDGHEAHVVAELGVAKREFLGKSADEIVRLCRPLPGAFAGLVTAAVTSGIEQALWDIKGRSLDVPVVQLLGGAHRRRIRTYANLNRSMHSDRSIGAFGAAAAAAVADGFTAVKIAPFDGLRWEPEQDRRARRLIDLAAERVHVVRSAAGPEVDVLIDCHGRMNPRTATVVLREFENASPYWVEAPVPEGDVDAWRRVRRATSMRLAGGEFLMGLEANRRFLARSGVDVLMADVKYCGGIAALQAIARIAESYGVELSPHNPSGPVATLASVHVAANAPNVPILEYAWGEIDWRSQLAGGAERLEAGSLEVPTAPGLGIDLDAKILAAHPMSETPIARDLWER